MNMNKDQKKIIDKIIGIFMYGIFLPFVLLSLMAKGVDICMKYLFENVLNPFYNKVCKIVRGSIPNSSVYIKGKENRIWHRVNEESLTIKEAKALGKEYENTEYEVKLSLSEL